MIRPMKNPVGHDLTEEELEKVRNYDLSIMGSVPYFLALWIMPWNF